ncbi:hypothetical protein BaRGS_00032615 [Batillaria attramentaria]|uniref:Uncharacterized protein n=1 Tax=Batillaria attramentaria TaxID=370345 RepID=A0ABD0JMD3_9CAEN
MADSDKNDSSEAGVIVISSDDSTSETENSEDTHSSGTVEDTCWECFECGGVAIDSNKLEVDFVLEDAEGRSSRDDSTSGIADVSERFSDSSATEPVDSGDSYHPDTSCLIDSDGSSEAPIPQSERELQGPRKRANPAKPDQWKCTQNKLRRMKGEVYMAKKRRKKSCSEKVCTAARPEVYLKVL